MNTKTTAWNFIGGQMKINNRFFVNVGCNMIDNQLILPVMLLNRLQSELLLLLSTKISMFLEKYVLLHITSVRWYII